MDKPENAHRNFPMLWLVASAVAGLLAFAAYFEIDPVSYTHLRAHET